MRPLVVVASLLATFAAPAIAAAENPLIEHAAEMSRAGQHAQAVADLRRAAISILTRPDDPAIRDALDRAHASWLGAIYAQHASAPPLERFAILGELLRQADRVGSGTATQQLGAVRDALATQLRPHTQAGDLRAQLLAARQLDATAGSSGGRTAELAAQLDAHIVRLRGDDANAAYLRDRLRSYYRVAEPPAHPRPIRAAWQLEVAASTCDDVLAAVRAKLEADRGTDVIAMQLTVASCVPTETRGSDRKTLTYYRTERVPRTVRTVRTERVMEQRAVQRRVCSPTYTSTGSTMDRGAGTITTTYMQSGENCYNDSGYEPVETTREIYTDTVVSEEQEVRYNEDVAVTTRTSRLALGVVVTARTGGATFQLTTQLAATHDDATYTAQQATSRAFDDARAILRDDLASQLAT